MDNCINLFDDNLSIEKYLNLGDHLSTPRLDRIDQQDQFAYTPPVSSIFQSQILPSKGSRVLKHHPSTIPSEVGSLTQKKSGKQATAKYRQKRKFYQQELELSVRKLEEEIKQTEAQIKKVKDAVLDKLESSIKAVQCTENAQIYTEIQSCLHNEDQYDDLADIDRINLLLNTLKFRIGPTGRERQAKIQYNFKSIVNTLFPGLHRYFLLTVVQQKDIFDRSEASKMLWTQQLMKKMNFTQTQKQQIREYEGKLFEMYCKAIEKINRIKSIKLKMRQQAIELDKVEDKIRQNFNEIQCAKFTIFCQKNKYRKEISLDNKFRPQHSSTVLEEEMEDIVRNKLGRKKVHLDPSVSSATSGLN